MCRVLGVSASGFYDWFERPQSKREQANAQLIVRIRASFAASDGTYGSPRILHDLQAAGETCSANRVARLMRSAGIKARHKRRRLPGQPVSAVHSVAPNLLERQFQASAPNQKWAADFTYVWTAEGWLFVAVVLDLYSRRVVGWSMQSTMTAQLVMDALLMAILRRDRPEAVLHHSDQGSQGGFNRSLQHSLLPGGCDEATQTQFGSLYSKQVKFARASAGLAAGTTSRFLAIHCFG
jgi:putative transposase